MKVQTVQPVLGVEERDAMVTALRYMVRQGMLVERDEGLIKGALEGLVHAPSGPQITTEPGESALGAFRREGPPESRKAAVKVFPRSGSQRLAILTRLSRSRENGLTREELADGMGLPISTVNPRVRELIDGGWAETKIGDEAKAVTRRTQAGNSAAVVVVSARGKAELRRRGARVTA